MRNGNVEKRDLALIDSIAEALEVFRVQLAAKSLSISVSVKCRHRYEELVKP